VLKRVLRNFGRVLRGRSIAAICAIAATGLMANALPVEQFGLVILLHTYIMMLKGFVNFRTFEAIVRFGIPLHDQGDEERLKALLRSTMLLDFVSSVAAAVISIAAVPVAARLLHWDAQLGGWAVWYSLVLVTTPVNTATGVLRLYDRFDTLGMLYTVGPALRLLLVAMAWTTDAPMLIFLLAWGVAFCVGNLYMIARGLAELRGKLQTPLWHGFRWREGREHESELWRFIGVVYWQTNVDLLPKHLSTLLAGNLMGPSAAGLFRLAREISSGLAQPAVMLREVLFPDLTRAWHAGKSSFGKLPYRTALIAGAIGLIFVAIAWLAGGPALGVVGEDYLPAKNLIVLLLVAGSFDLASAPIRAAAYAMGRATSLLRIHLLGIGVYIVLFYLLTRTSGLIGPGLAAILASLVTFSLAAKLVASEAGRHADL
jgi:O-antigen/teichoic acid export membrane protein